MVLNTIHLLNGVSGRLQDLVAQSFWDPYSLKERYHLWQASHSGPPFHPSHRSIIIDITTACNLGCADCNRSCGPNQAPAHEYMDVAQIETFIEQSVQQNRRWREIILEGGEPTLHPHLGEIIARLLDYKNRYSHKTEITLKTNGYGDSRSIVRTLVPTDRIRVIDSSKTTPVHNDHWPFNSAPCDDPAFAETDFSRGCYLPACYGVGLTRYGYYPHPVCGGIDRVMGLDIGRKELPPMDDSMRDQFAQLCPYCGFFRVMTLQRKDATGDPSDMNTLNISPSWKTLYARYRTRPPRLTLY